MHASMYRDDAEAVVLVPWPTTMSDVSSIRAEIKAWERSFKESNGREPTIEDIKKLPVIAQKYKLYKKLSKTATNEATSASTKASSSAQISKTPSTPVRSKSTSKSSTLLQSATRVIETAPPLETFNPFSPQKNKGKQKEVLSHNVSKSPKNPFLSPRKPDTRSQASADAFPPAELSKPTLLTETQLPTAPSSAISRARKRLRGEPVSPSPNKEKRRRVLSPNGLPFPKLRLRDSANDSDSEDEQDDEMGGISSFVDDTPMKPTANGKSFTFLFEDNAKPRSTMDLFGGRSAESIATDHPHQKPFSGRADDIFGGSTLDRKRSAGKGKSSGGHLLKSQPTRTVSQSKLVQTTLPTHDNRSRGPNDAPPGRASVKRSLSEIDVSGEDEAQNAANGPDPPMAMHELLPPSPDANSSRHTGKSKHHTARNAQQQPKKKAKRRTVNNLGFGSKHNDGDGDSDEDINSEGFDLAQNVKLVPSSRCKHAMRQIEGGDHSETEQDLILNYARRGLPRGQGLASPGKQAVAGHDFTEDEGVNEDEAHQKNPNDSLPQQFQRVLVVESLKSRKNDFEEEKIVKYLLSGRRVVHYDPRKGGEIWGVGEDDKDEFVDENPIFDEGEDEWEGDPVPWEAGELSESHYHLEEL